MRHIPIVLSALAFATGTQAACLSDAEVDALAAAYKARTPAANLEGSSKLMPPKPGLAVEVSYQGLPGTPTVSVKFQVRVAR